MHVPSRLPRKRVIASIALVAAACASGDAASGDGAVDGGLGGQAATGGAAGTGGAGGAAGRGSGVYWLDPDGAGALEVWCDMDSAGGGWTLAYKRGAGTTDAPHACSAVETLGASVGGLASAVVGGVDRSCGPERLLSRPATTLRCEWLDTGGAVQATAEFPMVRDTPWTALTATSGPVPNAGDPCTFNGLAGTVFVHPSGTVLWECQVAGQPEYALWHTTACCGGPWTFSDAWDGATEHDGRCWMR